MTAHLTAATETRPDPSQHTYWTRLFRKRMHAMLSALRGCELVLQEAGETLRFGVPIANQEPLKVHVHIHDPAFYRLVAQNGSVGVGEAYMNGLWDADDLTALVRVFVLNRDLLDAMEGGVASLGSALLRVFGALRRNTLKGSKRNISEHYDLGNDFFRLFLDQNLMYSSAIFKHRDESLDIAATRKLDRICQKLGLQPGMHVVEIGTGWGGFALHAAGRYGVNVTTTTISDEQYALAVKRVHEAGLADRVTVLKQDYRLLTGQYDRLVSIEMIEAIGHQYLETYFKQCERLLKPDGMAVIQAITIEDHRYQQALRAVDFIKRYIFPGSFIPSITAMLGAMQSVSDLKLHQLEDFGTSYAETLRQWHVRFLDQIDAVREQGYSTRFQRMWRWYLAYCEGGFLERSIGVVQMLLVRPGARRVAYLPDLDPQL